jgi:ParB/RepB/Spo0J family partition protein
MKPAGRLTQLAQAKSTAHAVRELKKVVENPDADAFVVPVSRIRLNPRNAREDFNQGELDALAESIKEHGILQAIRVRPITWEKDSINEYEVVAGERRLRAAMSLNMEVVPVRLERDKDDTVAMEQSLIENMQRSNFSDWEAGRGLVALRAAMQSKTDIWIRAIYPGKEGALTKMQANQLELKYEDAPHWFIETIRQSAQIDRAPKITWAIVAERMGLSESRVNQLIRVARNLSPEVTRTPNAASRALATMRKPEQQRKLAQEILEKGLTGRQAEKRAREIRGYTPPAPVVDPLDNLQTANSLVAEGVAALKTAAIGGVFRTNARRQLKLLRDNLDRFEAAMQ